MPKVVKNAQIIFITFASMGRFFIYLSYDGTNYCGWQVQPNGITVQEELEKTLSVLLRTPVSVTGAGRTDSGVHAHLMIAHADWSTNLMDLGLLKDKMNKFLPPDIAIKAIKPVHPEAHARFDALSRTYHYYISQEKDPFNRMYAMRDVRSFDFDRMNEAAQCLFDYEDFTSFSKLHTDVKTNNCRIMKAFWEQQGENHWTFTIQADRFLRNMVRAIVGTLLDVGRGKMSIEEFRQVIESKDRGKAGTSAPAHALFLYDVEYPSSVFVDTTT